MKRLKPSARHGEASDGAPFAEFPARPGGSAGGGGGCGSCAFGLCDQSRQRSPKDNAATATIAQGQAQFEAATAVVAQEQEAAQRVTAQAEAIMRSTAEADALDQRDRAVEAENDALVQASIGLGSQAIVELEGSAPERSVLLATGSAGALPLHLAG